MRLPLCTPIIVIFVCLAAYAAETTGRIYGRVTDASGAVVPNALIEVQNQQTGVVLKLAANSEGNYNAPKLSVGMYQVIARVQGFKEVKLSDIVLESGTIAEINVQLQPGQVSESITVTASSVIVDTTSGALRTSMNQTLVDRLPMSARVSNYLIQFVPGAVELINRGGTLAPQFAVNGLRDTSNNFTLNGTDASDVFNAKGNRFPNPEALNEFSVQSNYSAEYGRGAGVSVVAVTRSGTNDYHGSVFNFFRNDNLNANSFDRNATNRIRPEAKSNLGGVSLGGPVFIPRLYNGRNRTFFFFNTQRLFAPAAPYTWTHGGLTAAELAGDFSKSAVIPKVSTAAAAAPNSPFAGMAGQSVPDLRSLISPAVLRAYSYLKIPTVQQSGQQILENQSRSNSEVEYTARVDHTLFQGNTLSGFLFKRHQKPDFQKISGTPAAQYTEYFFVDNYSVADTWVLSPTLVNEVRVGRNAINQPRTTLNSDLDYSIFGLTSPRLSPAQAVSFGSLTPTNLGLSFTAQKEENRHVYEFRDTVSMVVGSHFLKAGVMLQDHEVYQYNNVNNTFSYSGGWLGSRAAEWLIGWPQSMCCVSEPKVQDSRKRLFHVFFQDDWKVTPRLSLNLGIRYEPQFWAYLKDGRGLMFVPFKQSQQYQNFPLGVLPVTDPQLPTRSGIPNDLNNFAPRLGFAYRLDSAGRFVVRGGWGLFYDFLDAAARDGGAAYSLFPFGHSYDVTYNLGYPGGDRWLDIFGYQNQPTPNFSQPLNPATAAFNPNSVYGLYAPNNKIGYTHQWNLTLEQEFARGWTWTLAWLGNRGVDLASMEYWNSPVRRDASDNWNAENVASRRPIQQYRLQTRSYLTAATGSSSYNAAQAQLKARLSQLTLNVAYTLSSTFADVDGIWGSDYIRSNPDTLAVDWARSVIDRPSNLQIVASWDLPKFQGAPRFVRMLGGGWTASPYFQVVSGTLVNVLAAQNNTFTCQSCSVRPDATGKSVINSGWRNDPNLVYVSTAAFSQPRDGTFGNLGRNAVRWPTRTNFDISVRKAFDIWRERVRAEVRGEFFNALNLVNFTAPQSISQASPIQFSMKNAWAGSPREVQIGLRLAF